MIRFLIISIFSATIALAGVDSKTYTVPLNGIPYRVFFYQGTAFVTDGNSNLEFPYTEPDPIGDIAGVPFYLNGNSIVLVLEAVSGTEITVNSGYSLSYVTSFPAYLWHGVKKDSDIYFGSYIQQVGDDPRDPEKTEKTATWQRYYKLQPPYTTYTEYRLENSGNHESCKPFFLGDALYVLTERGAVYNISNSTRYFVGDYRHYLLATMSWFGFQMFAWNPDSFEENNGNEGTKLWYWTINGPAYTGISIPDIMTFHMQEYHEDLYFFGQHPDYDEGRIYRIRNGVTELVFQGGVGFHSAVVFNNILYAGSGSRYGGTAYIVRLDGQSVLWMGSFPDGVNNFGTFIEYNGELFATGSRSNGSIVIMRLESDMWKVIFTEQDFTTLKPTAGTGSNLIQPTGFMVVTDKLYIITNDITGGRGGPSHLFSIEEVQ